MPSPNRVPVPASTIHALETVLRKRREQTDELARHLLSQGPACYPAAEDILMVAAGLARLRRTVTGWREEE